VTDQREPVDRELLAETIRLYGTAIEYRGQVFNPADVVVHTNGVTAAAKLSAVWSVLDRWRQSPQGVHHEAAPLVGQVIAALASGTDPACRAPNDGL